MADISAKKARLDKMISARANWESHWQEIVDYILPHRQGITTPGTPGEKRMGKIYDSTATHSLFLLAAGLHGMLTNPATEWFSLKIQDDKLNESEEVKLWLEDTEKRIFASMNSSNFGSQIHEAYIDLGGFGMCCVFIGESQKHIVYFDTRNIAEVFVAENNLGVIDTVYRKFQMTARQAIQQWGSDKVSSDIRKAATEDGSRDADKLFNFVHAVEPRKVRDPRKMDSANMPISSCYFEKDTLHELQSGGFEEMPYLCPRWSIAAGELFGRSPAMIALPDVKMLNQMEQDILRAGQKKLSPPLLMAHDGFIAPMRLNPSGVNFVRGGSVNDKLMSFPVADDLGYGEEKMEQKRNHIRTIFYNDMLQLVGGPKMTATEVMQRTEEKLRIMGPVLGRMQSECLSPMIDRVFGIMFRGGYLMPPPRALAGQQIEVEYISPLAKAQKTTEMQGIANAVQFLAPMVQIDPSIMDSVDMDQLVKYVWNIQGAPQQILKPAKVVEAIRQQRAQQQAAQQQMEQVAQIAQTAGKASSDLGKPVDQSSPLGALMGMMGAGTQSEAVAQ